MSPADEELVLQIRAKMLRIKVSPEFCIEFAGLLYEEWEKRAGLTCRDEGCLHYGIPHSHPVDR